MVIGFDASRAFDAAPTGTENYSYYLLKSLVEVDLVNKYRIYLRSKLSQVGSKLGELPANFELVEIKQRRLWTQVGLAWECFTNPPDLLFIPAHTLPVFRKSSLKTVVTIHDIGAEFLPQYHTYPSKIYLNMSTTYAVRNADRIIAVSKSTRKDLIEKVGANPAKVEVVYEGVDHSKFKVLKIDAKDKEKFFRRFNINPDFILFVGTVQPRKNLERLIEAFAKLLKKFDNGSKKEFGTGGLELVIVGKRGWLAESIYSAPERYGVEKKVKFLNFVDGESLPFFYNFAKAFVLPSLLEGFGLPVIEAMACGCPVVVSNCSSLPEIAGGAAVVFNPYKVDEIASSLFEVLTNQKLRNQMINLGLKQASKFSWQKAAFETLEVFKALI